MAELLHSALHLWLTFRYMLLLPQTHRPLRLSLFHTLLQNGHFPVNRMAEVRGEALVPLFIMPNQILQTLKKCLPYTLGHLEGQ